MAFDKVVDSTALEAGLTQIATAIREKGGTTDVLAFPDAMAAAITAIQAGGEYIIEHGTRTFTEDTFPYTTPVIIEHSLGKMPLFFFGVSGTEGLYKQYAIAYIAAVHDTYSGGISPVRGNSGFFCYATNAGAKKMGVGGNANKTFVSMNATQVTISASSSIYGFFFSSTTNSPAVINWWAVAKK